MLRSGRRCFVTRTFVPNRHFSQRSGSPQSEKVTHLDAGRVGCWRFQSSRPPSVSGASRVGCRSRSHGVTDCRRKAGTREEKECYYTTTKTCLLMEMDNWNWFIKSGYGHDRAPFRGCTVDFKLRQKVSVGTWLAVKTSWREVMSSCLSKGTNVTHPLLQTQFSNN